VPYILALTPYRHVFVTIDSKLISIFVTLHPIVEHDVVMAVFICLFACYLSSRFAAIRCTVKCAFTYQSRPFHVPQKSITCLAEFRAHKFLGPCKQNLNFIFFTKYRSSDLVQESEVG